MIANNKNWTTNHSRQPCLVALVLFALSLSVQGQTELRFQRYTQKEGLDHATVNALCEDKRGYLWIGTETGLRRFDGYEFVKYENDPENPNSLSHQQVSCIFESATGSLWVATPAGLDRFDRKREQFTSFDISPENPEQRRIAAMIDAPNDGLFTASRHGVSLFDPHTGSFEHLFQDLLPSNLATRSLLLDRQNRLWVGTATKGLFRIDLKSREFRSYLSYSGHQSESNQSERLIRCLLETPSGQVWAGTDAGLFRYESDTDEMVRYPQSEQLGLNDGIRTLALDEAGKIWLGTDSSGLALLHAAEADISWFRHQPQEADSLGSNRIIALLWSKQNMLWIGTVSGGLNCYDPTFNQFHLLRPQQEQNNLNHNHIKGLDFHPDGRMWIATMGAGLDLYDPKHQRFEHFNTSRVGPYHLASNYFLNVLVDKQERVWACSRDGGLYRKLKNKPFVREIFDEEINTAIFNVAFQDADQRILFGTSKGLFQYQEERASPLAPVIPRGADAHMLASSYSLYQKEPDQLWVGTLSNGAFKLAPDGTYTHYKNEPQVPDSLSANAVYCFASVDESSIWMGTSSGLNKLDLGSGKIRHINTAHGLPGDLICGLLPGLAGELWISTNHGLIRLNSQTEVIRVYNIQDGLQGDEFNTHSYKIGPNGKLHFGGMGGITSFFPDQIHSSTTGPELVFTELSLFNRPETPNEGRFPVSVDEASELNFNHGDQVVSIKFAGLSFSNPASLNYAYKLDGFHTQWIKTGSDNRVVALTNMDAGQYDLRVKAANGDGQWGAERVIRIRVEPAPWKSPLAFTLYVLILVGSVLGYVAFLRRINSRLEQKVAERTSHLERSRRQLLMQEKQASLGVLAAGIAHEIRNPLNFINNFAELSQELVADIKEDLVDNPVQDRLTEDLNHLASNAERIRGHGQRAANIVQSMMDLGGNKPGKRQPTQINELVHEFVSMALAGFKANMGNSAIQLKFDFDEKMGERAVVARDLSRVLINLVTNALDALTEHCPPDPLVTVQTRCLANELVITITDNGPGIPEAIQEQIFSPFFTTKKGHTNIGLGLSICFDLIAAHAGQLVLDSKEGQGSSFAMHLPLG